MKLLAWIGVVIFGIWLFAPLVGTPATGGRTTQAAAPAPPNVTPLYEPLSPVHVHAQVIINRWNRGGFNTVAIADMTLVNGGERGMKDLTIRCEVFAESGTTLQVVTHTFYFALPPKRNRRVREVNLGFVHSQARALSCLPTRAIET